jgi:hypothetical protein
MYQRLLAKLESVARRFRRLHAWRRLTVVSLAFALIGCVLLVMAWQAGWGSPVAAPVLGVVALVAIGVALASSKRSAADPRWVARQIEIKHADLATLLMAAVEQRPDLPDGQYGFLQATVIRDALDHAERHDWLDVVSKRRLLRFQWAGLSAIVLLAVSLGGLAVYAKQHETSLRVPFMPPALDKDYQVTVRPGDTEVERGASLVVTAHFDRDVPDDASLVYETDSGETARTAMSLSLSDPVFGARVADVQSDLTYRVQYAGQSTRDFRATVFELPKLERADAKLAFPGYTGMAEKRVEDVRRVTAVEGTELTLLCYLNKPVSRAQLASEEDQIIPLSPSDDDPSLYTMSHTLQDSGRYRLHLVDDSGRKNELPPEFVFRVTPNRPPDVKMALPARDVRVSPIEEMDTAASVWDDFGLQAYGVSYQLAGSDAEEVVLGEKTPRNERQEVGHLIDFEAIQAEPDQLLSYYFWAEDFGPDGKTRRTSGDMYFAEVRHFEEIFRQGSQPPGGSSSKSGQQGGNAQQAAELAELQKQIINATWTVIRREVAQEPTDKFAPDVEKLIESQQEVLEKLKALAEKIEDAQSKQHAAQVEKHMNQAIVHLAEAKGSTDRAALPPALSAEQSAYQALLRLRAREHRVVRANSQQAAQASSSASGRQSRAQQQLEQLKLKDSENRYETQRQADSQQEAADRETLQVLNRLRELARRQNDLNRRLKELQSALEEAKTEEEREQIRRQLKRLREQEEQILRDVDELAERMERPENQERMAQSRSNLEQTRQNVRNTSRSLEDGQVSQAVASGTRAERELEEMQEEFRKQAAGRFSEEMKELRDEARRLEEKENDLSDRLRNLEASESKSKRLRDTSDREEIVEGLENQREDLQELLGEMGRTVEEAEEAEPLMARELYDTLRKTQQRRVDDALDVARRLLDQGLADQSRAVESQAREGFRQLREGVEKAAESVLGDETEALRRAHDALTDLADQLNDEMARADLQDRSQSDRSQSARPGDQQAQPRPGDQQTQPRPGQEESDRPSRPGRQSPASEQQSQREGESESRGSQSQDQRSGQRAGGSQDSQGDQRPSGRPSQPTDAPVAPRYGGLRDSRSASQAGGLEQFFLPNGSPNGPFTGGDFLRWSDQLREVEEMLDDPEMRAETARIRDRARGIRRDLREREFQGPNWDIVRQMVAEPLNELRDRVGEELVRRGSQDEMVPIDRDPVPPQYAEQVRRYYEQLGSGQ